MLLVYMISTGMSWNGVKMFGMVIITELLMMVVLGKLEVIVIKDYSVAVAGATVLGIAGVRGATIFMPTSSTTVVVFVSSCLSPVSRVL